MASDPPEGTVRTSLSDPKKLTEFIVMFLVSIYGPKLLWNTVETVIEKLIKTFALGFNNMLQKKHLGFRVLEYFGNFFGENLVKYYFRLYNNTIAKIGHLFLLIAQAAYSTLLTLESSLIGLILERSRCFFLQSDLTTPLGTF